MKILLIVFLSALIVTLLATVVSEKMSVVAKTIIALIDAVVLSWSIVGICVWIVAWAFKFTFTLKLATGIWVLMFILRSVFTN